jgi:hypothetical protein
MAQNAGGITRSLKRFDQPIRREHAERKSIGLNGNGHAYRPETVDELRRAIAFADDHDLPERAGTLRAQLDELIRRTGQRMRTTEAVQ